VTWSPATLPIAQAYAACSTGNTSGWVVAANGDIWYRSNASAPWLEQYTFAPASQTEAVPGVRIQCAGTTAWVAYYLGCTVMQESYVVVRTTDSGLQWLTVASNPAPSNGATRPWDFGPQLGPWQTMGTNGAAFVGLCAACADSGTPSSALWVTYDGGLTFTKVALPGFTTTLPEGLSLVRSGTGTPQGWVLGASPSLQSSATQLARGSASSGPWTTTFAQG
jgi:hypothetical protein